jgi:hypothetical protein
MLPVNATAKETGAAADLVRQAFGDFSATAATLALEATAGALMAAGWELARYDGITARLVSPNQRTGGRVALAVLFALFAFPVWCLACLFAGIVGAILAGLSLGAAFFAILGPGRRVRVLSILDFTGNEQKNAQKLFAVLPEKPRERFWCWR